LAVTDRIDTRIVFFDPICPAPYSRATLDARALGGSEASAVRVAEAIDAVVMQHCRQVADGRYLPPQPLPDTEHVVVLRDARALKQMRQWFPRARFHVWLHDRVAAGSSRSRWLTQADPELAGTTLVCVSEFLRRNVEGAIRALRSRDRIETCVIFNPIDEDLAPGGEVDQDKLVFLSSPNKGLSYTLVAFRAIRRALPTLRLCVANPGYRDLAPAAMAGVEWLGALPPARAMQEARSALCGFMLNFVLPETFGLVFAEANALGTPVLAHDCGAAREVLHANNPVLPVRAAQRVLAGAIEISGKRPRGWLSTAGWKAGIFDEYVDVLTRWRGGARPLVAGDQRFRVSQVAREWRALLN
jgi:glycosyltransferase involved in cell wall biosynthesis